MKKCSHCGAGIPDAVSFCPVCNTETEYPQKQRGYDNYYDDVEPEDVRERTERKTDTGVVLKIALVAFGLIIAVAACIAVLCLI